MLSYIPTTEASISICRSWFLAARANETATSQGVTIAKMAYTPGLSLSTSWGKQGLDTAHFPAPSIKRPLPSTARLVPTIREMGVIVQIWTVGRPARSSSAAIAAPQRGTRVRTEATIRAATPTPPRAILHRTVLGRRQKIQGRAPPRLMDPSRRPDHSTPRSSSLAAGRPVRRSALTFPTRASIT